MRTLSRALLALVLSALLSAPGGQAFAQEQGPAPTPEQLADEQRNLLGALERLDEKMTRLAAKLRDRQPDQADRLEKAYQSIRERLLKEDMRRVIELLRSNNLLNALKDQEGVKEDIRVLLEILDGARRGDTEALENKLEKMRESIKQIQDLEKQQKELNRETQADADRQEQLGSLDEAKEAIQQLREQQAKLRKGELDQARQARLAEQVSKAAEDVAQLQRMQREVSGGEGLESLRTLGEAEQAINDMISRQAEIDRRTEAFAQAQKGQ